MVGVLHRDMHIYVDNFNVAQYLFYDINLVSLMLIRPEVGAEWEMVLPVGILSQIGRAHV